MGMLLLLTFVLALLIPAESARAPNEGKYNLRVGKSYLEKNKEMPGITVTDSGLQYVVIEKGAGTVKPTRSDQVKVHYEGTLINGKVFDSSYKRGSPATFGVSQVIAGWTEALQLMVPGDVFDVVVPSELAYGARGAGQDIGPNATLKFRVELLEVIGKEKAPPKPAPTEAPTSEQAPSKDL